MEERREKRKRRTKIEIMRDILEVLNRKESLKKTEIVYGVNLNFERATRILNWMIESGLVEVYSDRYKITDKGREILREIGKLVTLFK